MDSVVYTKEGKTKPRKWKNSIGPKYSNVTEAPNTLNANETEVKRLLSESSDSSLSISPQSAPSSAGRVYKHFEYPRRSIRTVSRTRSMSDEPVSTTNNDVVFNTYIPTTTRSMILPTSYSSGRHGVNPTSPAPVATPSLTPSTGSYRRESSHSVSLSNFKPGRVSRSSTKRSLGKEWTSKHWNRVKEMEQDSERAKRCSKLSSGFAPLMVFGGLVFLCIGISAATNNGTDKEKLKNLSTTPTVMGVIMLILGAILIATWAGCRGKAKTIEKQLLHGSRRNSEIDGNIIQNILAKLSSPNRNSRVPSPKLPGVTLDGIDILKSQSDSELRASNVAQRQLYLYNRTNTCENNRSNQQFISCTDVITV